MPFILLHLLVAIPCAVHAVRSGRGSSWLVIILMFPMLGSLVYVLTQVLPDLKNSRAAQQAKGAVRRVIDPEAERRKAEAQLAMSDTIANRLSLARAAAARGDFAPAIQQFQASLRGVYENDAAIMLELAQAQFAYGQAAASRSTLDALRAANPQFRSHEGHLLYARALEGEGDTARALDEYRALVANNFPGEEGRARLAFLLLRLGGAAEATKVFDDMQTRFALAPKFYREAEADWLQQVKSALGA
jgi:hypothetical protein